MGSSATTDAVSVDAVVIGAGMSGLYALHRLREQGLSVLVVDSASGVGGTWFWNRYPGSRLDSESYTYNYFFAPDLLHEWSWSEEFAGQPELERYVNFVADRLDLRSHIVFDTRVLGARRDEERNVWIVTTDTGTTFECTYLVSAVGILSVPFTPAISGLDAFEGPVHHTGRWPATGVDMAGRRVAVIGTGSSGVQIIPEIAKEAEHLTVFQRSANWAAPINNRPITTDWATVIRDTAPAIHEICMSTDTGFTHVGRRESIFEVSDEERESYLESLYREPGLTLLLRNFSDVFTDAAANRLLCEFLARKVGERVHDPGIAAKLIPTDHGYGQKRPPLETGYYETYNRDNVELVDLRDDPIVRITATAIETGARAFPVDVIVMATGFDAVTGAVIRLGIRGRADRTLEDDWRDGPRTYLGMMCAGFPNLFMVGGPQGTQANNPRGTEVQVDWISRCIAHARAQQVSRIEPTEADVDDWVAHVNESAAGTLSGRAEVTSWTTGTNIPGKKRAYLAYAAGMQTYMSRLAQAERSGYESVTR
jgi:cyclohexanone monooxygenase